jgi:PAS domain S-box-containing protein
LLPGVLVLGGALLAYLIHRLRKQKTLLDELFEQAPQAVALTTPDDRVIRINRDFTRIFGHTPQAAIGRRLSELIVPAESQDEHRRHADAVARGERVDAEGVRHRQDGSRFPAAITYVPFSAPGQESAVYAIYRDSTEHQRAEEAHAASEQCWRAIFDNSAVGIGLADLHGKITAANRAFREMVGYSEEELRAMTYVDLTYEEDRSTNAALAAEMWAGRLPRFPMEKRYRRKNGQPIWVRATISRSPGDGTVPAFGICIAEDITERKRVEARLSEYEKVVEGVQEMIAVIDREYRYLIANQTFLNYRALQPEQVIGHFVAELVGHETFEQIVKGKLDECFQGRVVKYEMAFTYSKLGRRDMSITYFPIDGAAGVDRIAAVAEDVTERKWAEEARTASEGRWRAIFDNSAVGIALTDMHGKFTAANRAYREMVGYSEEELRAISFMDLTWEEDRPANAVLVADLWAGRLPQFQLEKRMRRKNGQSIWVRITVSKSPGAGSMPAFGIGIVEDITERKRAEARLLEYEKVVEGLQDTIVVLDREYRYLIANRAFLDRHGMQPDQVVGRLASEILGQDYFERVIKSKLDECFQGRVVQFEMDFTYSKLGRRDLFATYVPIEGPTGVDRVAVVLMDITERKRVEAKLLEYEKVVESLQEVIVVVDRDYRYLIANRAFLDYRGLQLDKLVGNLVPEIVGQNFFDRVVKSKLDECFEGRVIKYEMEFMHSELGRRDLFASYFPIEGPTGIDRVAAVLEDVTERKRAERELQRSFQELHALNAQLHNVREEERTKLARELHDELGQALTAIKIGLAALLTAPDRGQQPQSVEAIMGLVDETIHSVRRISTELRPGILDHLGLVAAVEWAAEAFQARTGIQCKVGLPGMNPAIDPAGTTGLFRILQETLTNIARHAGATHVRIGLSQESGHVLLEVSDNGRGIGADQLSGSGSLGILGMRERAMLLRGEFSIAGDPGRGTTVRVRIPCADRRQAASQ